MRGAREWGSTCGEDPSQPRLSRRPRACPHAAPLGVRQHHVRSRASALSGCGTAPRAPDRPGPRKARGFVLVAPGLGPDSSTRQGSSGRTRGPPPPRSRREPRENALAEAAAEARVRLFVGRPRWTVDRNCPERTSRLAFSRKAAPVGGHAAEPAPPERGGEPGAVAQGPATVPPLVALGTAPASPEPLPAPRPRDPRGEPSSAKRARDQVAAAPLPGSILGSPASRGFRARGRPSPLSPLSATGEGLRPLGVKGAGALPQARIARR